jgi:two-component system sensor histidine kinase CpxA
MLSGEPGDRIAAIGDGLTQELSRIPEGEWPARLDAYDRTHGVTFALFANTGEQLFGARMDVPAEVMPRLIDRRDHAERPPPRRPQGPMMKRPDDAPPKPRFMLRAGNPSVYWAGIHLDLMSRSDGRPMILLMKSGSITGGGLFFDLWPWLDLAVVALAVSALIWMPLVRGITGFISALNSAAGRIARGKFDERIPQSRNDELGELSSSVNAMAAQLGDYMAQQRRITADVAHELCSPIARMQMALGVVEQRGTPEQASYLKNLDAELQHMAKLVEEVLAFSKAETLPEHEEPEDIDFCASSSPPSSHARLRRQTSSSTFPPICISVLFATHWTAPSATSCAMPCATQEMLVRFSSTQVEEMIKFTSSSLIKVQAFLRRRCPTCSSPSIARKPHVSVPPAAAASDLPSPSVDQALH